MNPYAATIVLALAALVDSSFLPHLAWGPLKPGLVVMLTISWGLLRGTREGALCGFIGGLALDLVSAPPLGLRAFLVCLTGFLAALSQIRTYRANILIPPLTMFLATAGYNLVFLLAYQAMGQSTSWPQAITQIVLPTALLNTILMPLIYLPLTWIHRRLSPSQLGW